MADKSGNDYDHALISNFQFRRSGNGYTMRFYNHILTLALSLTFLLYAHLPANAKNLLTNGGFDSTNPPLSGWKYNYEDTGNSNWKNNHLYVALTNIPGAREHALDLRANKGLLWGGSTPLLLGSGTGEGQGIMVDSDPVPVEPNGKYRLTVSARSTGCNARIFAEGYRWRPGIKPHAKPKLAELRKCYRFPLVNFQGGTPGTRSDVTENWKRASLEFPEGKMSPLAKESFDKVLFLVVHIIAIDLYNVNVPDDELFHLYVDDVVLERLN